MSKWYHDCLYNKRTLRLGGSLPASGSLRLALGRLSRRRATDGSVAPVLRCVSHGAYLINHIPPIHFHLSPHPSHSSAEFFSSPSSPSYYDLLRSPYFDLVTRPWAFELYSPVRKCIGVSLSRGSRVRHERKRLEYRAQGPANRGECVKPRYSTRPVG